MKPVTIGLIGAGFHARTVHIPAYDLVPELRLAAIATSREATALEAANRWRVHGYADYHSLLEHEGIEAVVICSPPETLEEISLAALRAGKHVFIETPGVHDVALAREAQELARQLGLVAQTGFVFRYSPLIDLIKPVMDSHPTPRLLLYEYYPFLSHIFNLALYLSGPVEHVLCATGDAAGSTATLRFRNGDTAIVVGRSVANASVNIESIRISSPTFYAAVEGRNRVRIVEDMKPVAVDAWGIGTSGGVSYEPHVFGARYLEQSGTAPMLRAFARAIRTGEQPRSTLEDAIETRLLMDEISRCARSS